MFLLLLLLLLLQFDTFNEQVRKRRLVLRHLYIKCIFYQDRLGTNIGKALKKAGVFSQDMMHDFNTSNVVRWVQRYDHTRCAKFCFLFVPSLSWQILFRLSGACLGNWSFPIYIYGRMRMTFGFVWNWRAQAGRH
jgi:hypothetical protein